MLSIAQIIETRAPQFSSHPRLAGLITLCQEVTNQTIFKDQYNYAIALRVMHWLTKEQLNNGNATNSGVNTAGTITSESEGETSRSYGNLSSSATGSFDDLKSTGYGQELIQLMRGKTIRVRNRMTTAE